LQSIKPRGSDYLEERLGDILQNFCTIKEAVKINAGFQDIITDAENNFTQALNQTLEDLTNNNLDELEKNLADYMAMIDLNNEQSNFNLEPSLNMSSNNQNQHDKEDQDLFNWKQYNQEDQQAQSKLQILLQKQVKINNYINGLGIGVN
jgi:lipopolysaccharide export LptBFGC system permease protein LptF